MLFFVPAKNISINTAEERRIMLIRKRWAFFMPIRIIFVKPRKWYNEINIGGCLSLVIFSLEYITDVFSETGKRSRSCVSTDRVVLGQKTLKTSVI